MKKVPFADFVSADSASIGVAEGFILFSLVTIAFCLLNNYVVWFDSFSWFFTF